MKNFFYKNNYFKKFKKLENYFYLKEFNYLLLKNKFNNLKFNFLISQNEDLTLNPQFKINYHLNNYNFFLEKNNNSFYNFNFQNKNSNFTFLSNLNFYEFKFNNNFKFLFKLNENISSSILFGLKEKNLFYTEFEFINKKIHSLIQLNNFNFHSNFKIYNFFDKFLFFGLNFTSTIPSINKIKLGLFKKNSISFIFGLFDFKKINLKFGGYFIYQNQFTFFILNKKKLKSNEINSKIGFLFKKKSLIQGILKNYNFFDLLITFYPNNLIDFTLRTTTDIQDFPNKVQFGYSINFKTF